MTSPTHSAKAGRDMLLKLKNDQGQYVTVAGLRTKALRFNARPIDVTHSESLNGWRELLPGAGVKTAEITGTGVFIDSAADGLIRTKFFDQSVGEFQFILPDFGIIEGSFLIKALMFRGTYKDEASYELSLVSAAAPSFTVI